MEKYLKRLWRKNAWIRIYTKSGGKHVGQIEAFTKEFLTLGYKQNKRLLNVAIKLSQIEAVECLECGNDIVWTTE